MVLAERIQLLTQLKEYFVENGAVWQAVKEKAERENGFFTQENIEKAVDAISTRYLDETALTQWLAQYPNLPTTQSPKAVGIVMAGNIPLVGMHDFIAAFVSGHQLHIKLSSKDNVLWQHIFSKMQEWNNDFDKVVTVKDMLKNCDAYIATGSNNTATYFKSYFSKYPNIIRRNRTSVAVLDGRESDQVLSSLTDDILSYYGLGCRNVSKIFVPKGYDFTALLDKLYEHQSIIHHHKYKNNYDYHLAIYLLNKVPYLTNDMILLIENESPFAPIATLHYEYYDVAEAEHLINSLEQDEDIQAIVTMIQIANNPAYKKVIPMGQSQCPSLSDYADGVDTMAFLQDL